MYDLRCHRRVLNQLSGQILGLPAYEQRHFEVIIDCTAFTSASEIPVSLLKYCTELVPKDIRQRLLTTYILNANGLMHRYLRKIYNISAGELRILMSADER